jgi:DNA-binding CsgD family transcriptional regulator
MEIFKIILLMIAYTLGIITIILQLICYLKEIEYKETLFLSFSFLLLIVFTTIREFEILTDNINKIISDNLFYFSALLLSLSIPLNIHKERIVRQSKLRNNIILFVTAALFLFLAGGFLFGFSKIAKNAVIVFLSISIIYSMFLTIRTKPSLLIKHKEKMEKITALLFLLFFSSLFILNFLNYLFAFGIRPLFDGPIILSFTCIILCVEKLSDDIKRLTLLTSDKKYSDDKISSFNISPRENEVLNLLVKGRSYKEIAEKLFISLPTVKTHVSNIYQKMNIKNKIELINLITD